MKFFVVKSKSVSYFFLFFSSYFFLSFFLLFFVIFSPFFFFFLIFLPLPPLFCFPFTFVFFSSSLSVFVSPVGQDWRCAELQRSNGEVGEGFHHERDILANGEMRHARLP